ncbi:hypothetical protein KQX54_004178 [Cotesia glomerata]|uniref:Uncharacterized protein n=1 Tax=Cotesia glomerata TaxID=32391 RepID=A0AAV7J4Y4_COTGL|nr:hypothetical protein KQX54_004178 [Cotesia glomerata]
MSDKKKREERHRLVIVRRVRENRAAAKMMAGKCLSWRLDVPRDIYVIPSRQSRNPPYNSIRFASFFRGRIHYKLFHSVKTPRDEQEKDQVELSGADASHVDQVFIKSQEKHIPEQRYTLHTSVNSTRLRKI